jgi:hypothetical protein
MASRPTINANEFIENMRSGADNDELMRTYGLSREGLYTILTKLLVAKAINPSELVAQLLMDHKPDKDDYRVKLPEDQRAFARYYLDYPLAIQEAARPENKGVIINITEEGVGLKGIKCEEGRLMTFVIPAYGFQQFKTIMFQAVCRWIKKSEGDGEYVSGFKIVERTEKNMIEFQKLIKVVALKKYSS